MADLSPGAAAPANLFIPAQRGSDTPHKRGQRRVRVMRVHGHWTVIEPRSSLLRCVARRLRATLSA